MTEYERHVMEHATAWRHPRRLYRNHYTAGPEQDSWPTLQALCARGLMRVHCAPSDDLGGMTVFAVTDAGIAALGREE